MQDLVTGPLGLAEFLHAAMIWWKNNKSFSELCSWITLCWPFWQVGGVKNDFFQILL